MRAPARSFRIVVLAAVLFASACGPTVDLTKGLQVEVVSSGWLDAGIVDGKNKLVPSVAVRLKNVSDQKLVALQVNAVFRRVNEKEEWGSSLLNVAGSEGLAAGATTPPLTIKSTLGYTGTESREEMLQNSQFVDANVTLFGKHGSTQWVQIAQSTVARKLVTP